MQTHTDTQAHTPGQPPWQRGGQPGVLVPG